MKKSRLALCLGIMMVSLAACGTPKEENTTTTSQTETESVTENTSIKDISLEEIHTAVKEVYGENYIPSMSLDETYITDVLKLQSDLYDEIIAEGPMISTHVDTFVAVKAKEGKGEEVEKILNDYRDYLLNDTMQYPMNMPKIQASSVVRNGDYVFFVMLGQVEKVQEDTEGDKAEISDEISEEELIKNAKESNQLAIDAIEKFFP